MGKVAARHRAGFMLILVLVLMLALMLIRSRLLMMAMIGIHIRHFGRYGLCPDNRRQA